MEYVSIPYFVILCFFTAGQSTCPECMKQLLLLYCN